MHKRIPMLAMKMNIMMHFIIKDYRKVIIMPRMKIIQMNKENRKTQF